MGVSVKTLQRSAKVWNICKFYTVTTDIQVEDVIREFLSGFPQSGQAMITGHMQSIGILC